jgi:hypothetical protein
MARSSLSNSLGSSGGAITSSSFVGNSDHHSRQRHHPINSSLENMFPTDDEVSTSNIKSPADLNVFVDDLLQQMVRFVQCIVFLFYEKVVHIAFLTQEFISCFLSFPTQ